MPLIANTPMPEIFSFAGYSIYFTALDRDHGVHVHVRSRLPTRPRTVRVECRWNGLAGTQQGRTVCESIRRLQFFLTSNYGDVLAAWRMFFGDDYHFDR